MPEERKLVTILFADVTGSTALGDELDPEDLRTLMGRYYAHARQIIMAHGGTLEKFIGDAVMAVFGLPRAHGDDAERALAAALALRQAVEDDPLLPPAFRLRIGVNSGEVVATGDSSQGDFLVTGDAVNVAARLQQGAAPGEILVSERTMQASRLAFLFGPAREVTVKGKPQPLRVFPLEAARSRRLLELPPFVGRQRDLEQLQLLLERTCEERRPYCLSLIGPAGSGKTRLLAAFLDSLASCPGLRIARASCPPYGQLSAAQPLSELLGGLLHGESASVSQAERTVLQACFREQGYSEEDAARLTALILQSLGLSAGRNALPASIFAAWQQLIEGCARRAPCLIIVDDLHHAPDSLLDLIEALLGMRAAVPLLLILLSRPELLERRRNWGASRQNFLCLTLPPLTREQIRTLLAKTEVALPGELREEIVERADGNPFFALELVRGLQELQQQGRSPTGIALPDTVHASLLARLDLLPAPARRLLQIASVAGRSAPRSLLQAIFLQEEGLTSEDFEEALNDLLLRELLAAEPTETLTFSQNLVRDVAYTTLARGERLRLHSRIAAWLEQQANQPSAQANTPLIAYHYREALHLARQGTIRQEPPFPSAVALRAFEQAGLLAASAGAFAEARRWLELAIELAAPDEQVRLYELLGDCFYWGDTRRAAYQEALERWRSLEQRDPLSGARLLRKLIIGDTRFSMLHPLTLEEVVRLGQEALTLAEQAGDEDEIWRLRVALSFGLIINQPSDPLEAQAHQETASLLFTNVFIKPISGSAEAHTHLETARNLVLQAIDYFEQRGDQVALSEALDALGGLDLFLGNRESIISTAMRRLSLPALPAEEYIDAINGAAYANLVLGQLQQVIDLGKTACSRARAELPLPYLSRTLSALAIAAFLAGQWEEIDALLPLLEATREQIGADVERIAHLADAYACALFVAQAREATAEWERLATLLRSLLPEEEPRLAADRGSLEALRQDDPQLMPVEGFRPDYLHLLYLLRFYSEHGLSAPPALLTGAEQLQSKGDSPLLARYLAIAQALATNNLAALARAIDEAETAGHLPHAARMRLILAQRSGDRQQLERARPILERLRDRRALRRLARIEALPSNAPPGRSAS
jgi:class 3 adenylate cyclase